MDELSIKAARINRGYKQSEVAELLGLTLRAYVEWENGGVTMKPHMLYAIAHVLDMDSDHIRVPVKK